MFYADTSNMFLFCLFQKKKVKKKKIVSVHKLKLSVD